MDYEDFRGMLEGLVISTINYNDREVDIHFSKPDGTVFAGRLTLTAGAGVSIDSSDRIRIEADIHMKYTEEK